MPKVFYTEKDIEDMVKRGTLSLEMNDNVVLTDLAYEKANRLGLKLVRDKPENPPAAPVRPYVVQQSAPRPNGSYLWLLLPHLLLPATLPSASAAR